MKDRAIVLDEPDFPAAAYRHPVTSVETPDAIARTEREIALMQEYRTRLTADLVTGKLDVREAPASLPEEAAFPSDPSDLAEETTAEEES